MYNTIDEFVSQKIRDIEHCRERIRDIYRQLEKNKIDTTAIKQIIEEREENKEKAIKTLDLNIKKGTW